MVAPKILLQKLQPYKRENIVLVNDQDLGDIINGIIKTHGKYAKQYEAILPYFEDDDIVETAKNVFEFLKQNCKYVIESDQKQTLRSPSAIIATGKNMGCDCKSYSLFFGGILSAYKRKYNTNDKLFYRFAGYNGKDLQHVFVVCNHDGEDYWCDAVLDYFDDRSKSPTKIKDKNMALISMAGIGNNISSQIQDYTSIGKSRMVFGIGNNGDDDERPSIDIKALWQQLSAFFDNSTNKWKSRFPVLAKLTPVDRLLFYIETINNSRDFQDAVQYSQLFQNRSSKGFYDVPDIPYNLAVKWNTIMDSFFGNNNIAYSGPHAIDKPYVYFDLTKVQPRKTGGGSGSGSGGGSDTGLDIDNTKTAGFSPLILLALIGAGAAFFLRGNKSKRKK